MDLSTSYLGMKLPHPLMPGASPLVDDMDTVRRLEDAGAAAIVMHSLFEEQVLLEHGARSHHLDSHTHSFGEALSFLPESDVFALGPHEYLEQLYRIRRAVKVPVIASLNGVTVGGWLDYARLMEQAGAHALELNFYHVSTDPEETGQQVEDRLLEIVRAIKAEVSIPLAVKLSPYFSSLPNLALKLEGVGANGLVLFNRFYQPEINIEELEVSPTLHLSDSSELLPRLRALAVLSGQVGISLACTGGVHTHYDAIKALMAGAHGVQLTSALLKKGPEHLKTVRDALAQWLYEHEYESLTQMRGSMSLSRCPDPSAYERGNYMKILMSWHKS